MATEEQGKNLHERAARGEALTSEEQSELEKWYARHDQEESFMLNSIIAEGGVEQIQTQIDEVLKQLGDSTTRIQELVKANESLRSEISLLRNKLAGSSILQPA